MSKFETIETVEIPPQSGRAVRVKAGALVRIVDVEGAQVGDAFARSLADPDEWLSAGHTRTRTRRLFPMLGESFWTNKFRRILTLLEDTSPGFHDMLYPPCEPLMYGRLGAKGDHPNCLENFQAAAASVGWGAPFVPDPVNFFQNTPLNDAGQLDPKTALSKAGDAVTLQAEIDLILVVTACSQDIVKINGDRCTGLRIEIGQMRERSNRAVALLG
jgi:uncharacterized protein